MIHPTALVSANAQIASDVTIGPFTIVHENVTIGQGSSIDGHCEIGYPTPMAEGRPLVLAQGSRIRSHSVFYEGSTFGQDLVTGHRVTVREGTVAGARFQIGTLGDIQGHCSIGDDVRLHSSVHIGQDSEVGNYVWIFPYVVLTNDPHPPSEVRRGVSVLDFAAIATMTVILPGVTVGRGALVGAHSSVRSDVPDDMVAVGAPAKVVGPTSGVTMRDGSGRPAYPWRRHFHRGYPVDAVEQWIREFAAAPTGTEAGEQTPIVPLPPA